jgi:hypothetical protein
LNRFLFQRAARIVPFLCPWVEPARIIKADRQILVGISAVIRAKDGGTSFWALTHCGSKPDFHNRESFIVEL